MNTRAGQYSTDASIRVPRRSAAVEHIEAVEQTAGAPSGMRSGEHASSGRTYPTALAPRAAAGFMLLMAAIGSTAGLAWRLHSDLSLLTESEHRDRDELEASVQRLEVVGQQAAQRLDALQQAQTKQELQLTEIRRLSEHVSSLQGELERIAKAGAKQEPPKRHPETNAQPKPQAFGYIAVSEPAAEHEKTRNGYLQSDAIQTVRVSVPGMKSR